MIEQPLQTPPSGVLSQNPQGLNGAGIEVSVESFPDMTVTAEDDGGYMVDFGSPVMLPVAHSSNLVQFLEKPSELASDLLEQYQADRDSREEWEKTYIQGLDLLGLKIEERTKPWAGACGVFHPMLTESVVRFQAQTIQEIFPASGPVKTSIVGDTTAEKTKQAYRVQNYMNYLATKLMVEYRNETEKLLFSLPIAGSAFRKVYFDPSLGRPASMFVPAEDCIVSYGASDLSTAPRVTHIMKRTTNDVRKLQVSGFYVDIELPDPQMEADDIKRKYDKLTGASADYEFDQRHTLLEMQVELDLEGFEDTDSRGCHTRIALPYVVTIDYTSSEILSVYRNWKEGDIQHLKREHFVHYQYLPGLGFYGFGLVHMIGGLTKSATSILRQLIDAGTLATLSGGLKARGLRIKGDDSPLMPGEFRDVDIPSGAIRDNIAFMPYKEPSAVLYQLLGDVIQEGRRFASAADLKASDMNAEAPVGTTLAILEREMKVISAITARVHASMGKELNILSEIITDFGPENYPYEVEGNFTIQEDFDDRIDIIPVSDPNAGTMAQRIMQYQAALQLAATAPQMYDLPLLHRQMLDVLGIQDTAKIIPTDDDLLPSDPVSENMAIITGKPVKAFMYQDHEAHIRTHIAAAQNPQLQELLKQNPNAGAVQAAAAAHLSEHLAFAYRRKIEEQLGVEIPTENLPEDIELRLSRLVAPAAEQLARISQQQAQEDENAKNQDDPIVQMAQEELRIKGLKAESDAQDKRDKLAADVTKSREAISSKEKIAAGTVAAKVHGDEMMAKNETSKLKAQQHAEGFKIGYGAVKEALFGSKAAPQVEQPPETPPEPPQAKSEPQKPPQGVEGE